MWPFRKIYEVSYTVHALRSFSIKVFIKARDIADIQRKLDKKESPWKVEINEIMEVS